MYARVYVSRVSACECARVRVGSLSIFFSFFIFIFFFFLKKKSFQPPISSKGRPIVLRHVNLSGLCMYFRAFTSCRLKKKRGTRGDLPFFSRFPSVSFLSKGKAFILFRGHRRWTTLRPILASSLTHATYAVPPIHTHVKRERERQRVKIHFFFHFLEMNMYVCIRNERDAISFANVAPSILLRRVLNVCPLVLVTFFFFCFIKSLLLLYIGTFKSAHLDASSRRRRRSFFSSPPPIYSPPRASSSPRGFRAAISIPKILLTKRPMRTVNARIETMSLRKKKKKETQKRKEKNDDPSRKSLVSRFVQTSLSIIKQQTDNPFGRSFLCFHSSRYVCPSKLRNILHSFYRRNFGERAALVARYVCTYIVTKILVKLVIARATVARARSEIKTRIKREVHYAASSLIGPPSTREYLEPGILRCPERKKKPPPSHRQFLPWLEPPPLYLAS